MLSKLRIASLKRVLPLIIIFVLLGAMMGAFAIMDVFASRSGLVDFDSLAFTEDTSKVVGTSVSANIYGIYDSFAEETENGRVTARWYIIDAGDYYMAMKVTGKKDIQRAEKLLDVSLDYLDGIVDGSELEAYTFEEVGKIHSLTGDVLRYYRQYYRDYDDEELEALFLPICLEIADDSSIFAFGTMAILLCVIAFLFVLPVIFSGRQVKRFIKNSGNEEVTKMQLESFYFGTKDYTGSHVDNRYILLQSGSKQLLFNSDDVAWAYVHQQNTRYMGVITVSKVFSVIVCTTDGKRHSANAKKEESAREFLTAIANACPRAVVGYSDELDKMFRKDRQAFLNLKYYQAPSDQA